MMRKEVIEGWQEDREPKKSGSRTVEGDPL